MFLGATVRKTTVGEPQVVAENIEVFSLFWGRLSVNGPFFGQFSRDGEARKIQPTQVISGPDNDALT